MAIHGSGTPILFTQIEAEFGQNAPRSLSAYYRGGARVPNGPAANNNIATSGAINMGSFYGATNRIVVNLSISANTSNYSIWANKGGTYVAGITDIILTITGAYTVSASGGNPALDTGSGWSAGDTLSLINTSGGVVQGQAGTNGAGGTGGNSGTTGSYNKTGGGGSNAGSGGIALKAQFAISVTNAGGTLAGGVAGSGGGGGGGGDMYDDAKGTIFGAGGGGGAAYGGGGTGYNGGGGGSSGAATTGGAGGTHAYATGGNGGNLGAAGSAGNNVNANYHGSGGAAGSAGSVGYYINGNSYVTWVSNGTRTGNAV
jgi:hypothetical protein